ncbi:unnamed protein product [Danaus chrysippus]|uniref:(African queen) hypothetical protein n=1 Tax=Danaus chrysippus TaxID=151541 RepID=A0A8J2MIP2_9NEOP|nr:unnamed protein product [Danaus chrysippus]
MEICWRKLPNKLFERKNVILSGVPEPKSSDSKKRHTHDKEEVLKTSKDCPVPTKVIRIGKYKPNNIRAIKVHFELEQSAKLTETKQKQVEERSIKDLPGSNTFSASAIQKS